MSATLSWRPSQTATHGDLRATRAYYDRSIRKLIGVLADGSAPRCLAVVERLDRRGLLVHPYAVEWFNRQRSNLEQRDREVIFAAFDELPDLERRIVASEERRARAREERGAPFDFFTPSAAIPHAIRHLRSVSAEAANEPTDGYAPLDVDVPDDHTIAVVADAWRVLERFWPEVALEIGTIIRTFSFFADDFVIGGALQSFLGGIFLCKKQATDGIKLGEEIVHESAHARLFLIQIDRELWRNPEEARYASVLRRDPRPFWGLYHQVFVLTRLAEYYGRVVREHPEQEEMYARSLAGARQGIQVIQEVGELTPDGAALFATMREAVAGFPAPAGRVAVAVPRPAPLSPLGLRIMQDTLPKQRPEVIAAALAEGMVAVDLSDTGRLGTAIDAAGNLLRSAAERAGVGRDRLRLLGHLGAVPSVDTGAALNDGGFMALLAVRYIKAGILAWDDLVWFNYSWAPRFLEWQLRGLVDRLGLGPIDRAYLEGPELLFRNLAAAEALRRCREACRAMERQVAAGLIRDYGVSLFDPGIPLKDPSTLDLEAILACAEEAGGAGHHLRSLHVCLGAGALAAFAPRLAEASRRGLEVVLALSSTGAGELLVSPPPAVDQALVDQGLIGDGARLLQLGRSVDGVSTVVFAAKTLGQVREAAQLVRNARMTPDLALDFFRRKEAAA
jgi:hypothetical protein